MAGRAASPSSAGPNESTLRLIAMPHAVYVAPFLLCPWPGCGFRIEIIDFQLVNLGDPALYAQLLRGWWQGGGLVGRCPGCQQYVLFDMNGKRSVADPAAAGLTVLPDDWHQTAYIA
jgi:hypothetical protein